MALTFDAIFCDDLRAEQNGKIILVGVYPANIAASLPVKVALCVYLRIFAEEVGAQKVSFRIATPKGTAAKGEGDVVFVSAPSIGVLTLPKIQISLEEEGKLELWASYDDQDEVLAGAIDIVDGKFDENVATNATPRGA